MYINEIIWRSLLDETAKTKAPCQNRYGTISNDDVYMYCKRDAIPQKEVSTKIVNFMIPEVLW